MGTITKKLKRSIVMLLVCALFAGSIPVNTYAAEIDSDAIASEETVVDETPDTEPTEAELVETTSGNGDGEGEGEQATKYDVTVVYDGAGANVEYPETVSENQALSFTVTVEDDYVIKSIDVTVGGEDALTKSEAGTYEIPNVTGDVVITVVTEAKKAEYEPKKVTFVGVDDIYTVNVVSGIDKDGNTVEDDAIRFTVSENDGYGLYNGTYKVGENGTPTQMGVGDSDNYYIITAPGYDNRFDGDIEINFGYFKYATVLVDAKNAEVELLNGYDNETKKTTGGLFEFWVAPLGNCEVTKVEVKFGDTVLSYEGDELSANGMYSVDGKDIKDDVTITVVAEQPITYYDVTFVADNAVVYNEDFEVIEDNKLSVSENEVVKFTVSANDGFRVDSVVVDEEPLEADENGFYEIKVTSDVTVVVNVAVIEKYDLGFVGNKKAFEVTDVKVGGKDAKVENFTVTGIAEKTSVSFKINATGIYKLINVVVGGEELTPVDGVYTLDSLKENTFVYVATELDETKCNVLNFVVDGFANGATMDVEGKTAYSDGEKHLTSLSENNVLITVKDGFTLTKLEINGEEVDATKHQVKDVENQYALTISYTAETREQEIKVTVDANEIKEARQIQFTDAAKHMTYKVDVNDFVKKVILKRTVYNVLEGAKTVDFTVTASGKYTPVVTLNDEVVKFKAQSGSEYTYSVAAASLVEGANVVRIEEEPEKVNVKVTYDTIEVINGEAASAEVIVTASIDGKAFNEFESTVSGNTVTDTYTVDYGTVLNFTVEAQEHHKITKATTTADQAKNEKVKAEGFTYSVKAESDTETVIESEGLYYAWVYAKDTDEEVEPVKGKYTVVPGKVYVADVYCGYEEVAITGTECNSKNGTTVSKNDAGQMEITVSKKDAKKSVTVDLVTEKETVTVKLSVLPLLKSATVKGVNGDKLTQEAGTTASYDITLNPKNAVNNIKAEAVSGNDAGITAEVVDGKLRVEITAMEAGKEAAYKIVGEDGEELSKVFTIVSAAPAWVDEKPTAKLQSATDTILNLTLGAKKVINDGIGDVYYKVVATRINGEVSSNDITTPQYFAYEAASQTEAVKVIDAAIGAGEARDYKVTVSLVQTKEDNLEPEVDDNIAFSTTVGKEAVINKASTKNPYYETKLSLKKGTTTVYTGQQDVVIATPNFGKNTTYMDVETSCSVAYSKDGYHYGLTARVNEDGKVVLTVPEDRYIPIGKYNVTVTAIGPATMHKSTATIAVNVVRGIDQVELNIPSTSVYKADKKAASFKVDVTYNGGYKNYQPKTKKVEWKISGWDTKTGEFTEITKDHELYNLVSIKNGKVTINKNYVLRADEDQNYFVATATAADFKPVEGQVRPCNEVEFTITNQAAELGEVVIVEPIYEYGETDEYRFVAQSGSTVTADELTSVNTKVVVLKEGVDEKDVYTGSDFADAYNAGNVTFKSSNKAVDVDTDGWVYLNTKKPVKNVKITVTATDGSKKAAVLDKLTVDYVKTADLGLDISSTAFNSNDSLYQQYKENGAEPIEFYGVKDTAFEVYLVDGVDEWGNANSVEGMTNHKLAVNGGKILYSSNTYYVVVANSDTVTLTLTDNSKTKDKVKTYVLKNLALSNEKAIKVSTKDKLLANVVDPQTIEYKVGNSDYDYTHVLVTVDAVDSDKKYWPYEYLVGASNGTIGSAMPVNDGVVNLTFEGTYIPANSYKLKFSFGNIDEDNNFIAVAKETAVTLKATAKKVTKVNAKLNAKYTMDVREANSIALTLNNKKATLNYGYQLLNANINGQENDFIDYFRLEGNRLVLKKDPGDLTSITGWITGYRYSYEGGWANGPATQITVTFKDSAKYTMTSATVLKKDTISTTVNAMANKKEVALWHVVAAADSKFSATIVDGAVLLTASGNDVKIGENKVSLYVVPAGSFYAEEISGLNGEAYVNAVKGHGIPVTAKVTVKDPAKITNANQMIKFKSTTGAFDGKTENSSYDNSTHEYWLSIPYTKLVDEDIKTVSINDVPVVSENSLINVYEDNNQNIVFTVSKEIMKKAVAEGTVTYGKKLTNVEVTFDFGNGVKEDLVVKFTLTLPKKAVEFEDTVDAVRATLSENSSVIESEEDVKEFAESAITWDSGVVVSKYFYKVSDEAGINKEGAASFGVVLTDGTQSETIELDKIVADVNAKPSDLVAKLRDFVALYNNGDIEVTNATTHTDILKAAREALNMSEYPELRLYVSGTWKTLATDYRYGNLQGYLVLASIADDSADEEVEYNLDIYPLQNVGAAKIAISNLFDNMKVYNTTTKQDILDAVAEVITNDDIEYSVSENGFVLVPATVSQNGTLTVEVTLTNDNSDADPEKYPNSYWDWDWEEQYLATTVKCTWEIAELKDFNEAMNAVRWAVTGYNLPELVKSNDADTVKEEILKAASDVLKGDEYTVQYAAKDSFEFKPATYKAEGSVSFKLELVKDGKVVDNSTIEVKDAVVAINKSWQTLADAKADVAAALKADTVVAAVSANTMDDDFLKSYLESEANIAVVNDEKITVSFGKDFAKVEPTIKKAGSVKGEIILTFTETTEDETTETTETVEFSYVIPMKEQTMSEAANAINAAVSKISVSLNDITDKKVKAEKEEVILATAKEVIADKYEVSISGNGLEVADEPTTSEKGRAAITLLVACKDEKQEVLVEWTLDELPVPTYKITVSGNNVGVSYNGVDLKEGDMVEEGTEVSISLTADLDYNIETVTIYVGGEKLTEGAEYQVTDNGLGTYTYVIDAEFVTGDIIIDVDTITGIDAGEDEVYVLAVNNYSMAGRNLRNYGNMMRL